MPDKGQRLLLSMGLTKLARGVIFLPCSKMQPGRRREEHSDMPIHPNTRDEERRCSCCLILTGPYSSRDGLCSECAGSIQRIMAEEGCSQMEARAKWEQRYWGQGE